MSTNSATIPASAAGGGPVLQSPKKSSIPPSIRSAAGVSPRSNRTGRKAAWHDLRENDQEHLMTTTDLNTDLLIPRSTRLVPGKCISGCIMAATTPQKKWTAGASSHVRPALLLRAHLLLHLSHPRR